MNKKTTTVEDVILAMERNDVATFKNFVPDHKAGVFISSDVAKYLLAHVKDDTDPAIVLRVLRSFANNLQFYNFARAFFATVEEDDTAEPEDFGEDIAKDLKDDHFSKRSLRQIRKMDGDYINAFVSYALRETDSVDRNLNYAVLTAIFNAKILPQRELALMVAVYIEDVYPLEAMATFGIADLFD